MKNVGVVGCGGISKVHAAVLSAQENVRLVCCADIRVERAQSMAERYGLRAYDSLQKMLDEEHIDVLHICTPHYLHVPMIKEAVSRGIAAFCEKPPVVSYEQLEELRTICENGTVGFCFQNRYNRNVLRAQELISSGVYGAVTAARGFVCWKRDERYYLDSGWRGTWATECGGALINQSIHTLDLLIRLCGVPDFAEATMRNHHLKNVIEVEDTVEAYMQAGNVPVLFYATTAYGVNASVLIEIQLEKAALRLENDMLTVITDGHAETEDMEKGVSLGKSYWGSGHQACIRDFYDALEMGRTFLNDFSGIEDTARTMLKLYDSGKKYIDQ